MTPHILYGVGQIMEEIYQLRAPTRVKTKVKPNEIAHELGIVPAIARVLISRGYDSIEEAKRFLYPKFEHLRDPFDFPDMKVAVDRILLAITQKEQMLVWGHNDVDGITATALLVKVIRDLGGIVNFYIPVCRNEVASSLQKDVSLIITVDCGLPKNFALSGVTSRQNGRHPAHNYVRDNALQVDIIVTDHHEFPLRPDGAFAFINPKLGYGFSYLAGVGVAYKLAQSLTVQKLFLSPIQWFSATRKLLPLVLLGTIADRVELVDENRILVKFGMEAIKGSIFDSIGVNESIKLLGSARANPSVGVEFLLTNLCGGEPMGSPLLCKLKELKLEQDNNIQAGYKLCLQIKSTLGDSTSSRFIFVHSDELDPNITGVCASKLLGREGLSSIVIGKNRDGILVGEARAPEGVDLIELFKKFDSLFIDWGGHKRAAGFSMYPNKLDEFKQQLSYNLCYQELTRDRTISKTYPSELKIDTEITPDEITSNFFRDIELLEPFGPGNPNPLFLTRGVAWGDIPCLSLPRTSFGATEDGKFDVIWSVEQGKPIVKEWSKV